MKARHLLEPIKGLVAPKVIFLPWVICLEQSVKCLKWQRQAAFSKLKTFHLVHFCVIPNPILLFMVRGQIYIRGHGAPNDPEISPGFGAIEGDLTYQQVADRLIQTGLQKWFMGSIKLWNCNSGVAGNTSFAKQFADEMRDRGYTKCSYYGYQGALDSYYYKGDDNEYHRFVGDDQDEGSRASNNRIPV